MKSTLIATAAGAALLPLAATAASFIDEVRPNAFVYDYAQVQIVDFESGPTGLSLGASIDIRPNLSITGTLTGASGNGGDYDLWSVGAAYHARWVEFEKTDLIVHGALGRGKTRYDSDVGIALGARVRAWVRPHLELYGDLTLTTVLDTDLAFTFGAAYSIPDTPFQAFADYRIADDDRLAFGLRYYLK